MEKTEHEMKNYYEILEIPYDAGPEQVNDGYLRAKNAYSGDSIALYSLLTPGECKEILDCIETAYSVLSMPVKRSEYDRIKGFNQFQQNRKHSRDHEEAAYAVEGEIKINNHSNTQIKDGRPTVVGSKNSHNSDFNLNEYLDRPMGNAASIGRYTPVPSSSHYMSGNSMDRDFSLKRSEAEVSRINARNKFRLEYTQDLEFEQAIENATEFGGDFLRQIREYKNVTLDRMSDLTKISKTYIRQIEKDSVETLPALAYVRGFVYQYAKCLKLNPELVASSYLNQLKRPKAKYK